MRHGNGHVAPVFETLDVKGAFQYHLVDQIVTEDGVAEHFLQNHRDVAAAQIVGVQRPELLVIRENHVDGARFVPPFQFRALITPCLVAVGIVAEVDEVVMQTVVPALVFDQVFLTPDLLLPEKGGNLLPQFLAGGLIRHRRLARQVRTAAPMAAGKSVHLQERAVLRPEVPVMKVDVECPVIAAFHFSVVLFDLDAMPQRLVKNPEQNALVTSKGEDIPHHRFRPCHCLFRQSAECVLDFVEFVFFEVDKVQTSLLGEERLQEFSGRLANDGHRIVHSHGPCPFSVMGFVFRLTF